MKEISNTNLTSQETNIEVIKKRIYEIRGQRVMIDRDLAELYGVETRTLNQAVKRNMERFPEDFVFTLTEQELENWKSQIVISNSIKMGLRKLPLAFTELGIAMLSSVLRSETAIQVNINIMRAFVMIRQTVAACQSTNMRVEQLSHKVDVLNSRVDEILHEQYENNTEMAVQIDAINEELDKLMAQPDTPRKRIGFKHGCMNDDE